MLDSRGFRELLVADLAVARGIASAPEVAAALQHFWTDRGLSVAEELARIARLAPEALNEVVAEADRLITESDGDASVAIMRRGGLERSIHLALSKRGSEAPLALTEGGVGARTPLRTVDQERYTGFEVAGSGGMGVVYLALDTEMNRTVAFKMVRPHLGPSAENNTPHSPIQATPPSRDTPASRAFAELKARFLQEAWVTGGLSHPGIVPVYEMGLTPKGVPYYTMKFVRGRRTMKDELDEVRDGPADARVHLLESFLKLCDTVAYAHSRGVVHRDLKPENVALGEFGEVVLLDWGLAKLEGREDLAASAWQNRVRELRTQGHLQTVGSALGTPGYMSPEAALGRAAQVGERSDVYSLGVVLFEILTGRLPYDYETYAEFVAKVTTGDLHSAADLVPGVPASLSELCTAALSKRPEDRIQGAAAMAAAIRDWQAQTAVEREVEAQITEAETALASAADLVGRSRIRLLERASGACARVLTLRPEHGKAQAYVRKIGELREAGVRDSERLARRQLLTRLGVSALVALAVGGYLIAGYVNDQRREALDAQRVADAAHRQSEEDRKSALAAADRERATNEELGASLEREKTASENARRSEMQAREAEDEERKARQKSQTLVNLLLKGQGRQEILRGFRLRALPYLVESYRQQPDDPALRFMLAYALQSRAPQFAVLAHRGGVASALFSPDGSRMATGGADGVVRVWDVQRRSLLSTIEGHRDGVHSVRFDPTGRFIVSAGCHGVVVIAEADTGRVIRSLVTSEECADRAEFLRGSARVLVQPAKGRASVWRVKDGSEVLEVGPDVYADHAVTAQPAEGALQLLTLDLKDPEQDIRIWSSQDGQELGVLRGSRRVGRLLRPSRGSRVVALTWENALTIWDVSDRRLVASSAGHSEEPLITSLGPDGETMAYAPRDGDVRLLRVTYSAVDLPSTPLESPSPHPDEEESPPHRSARQPPPSHVEDPGASRDVGSLQHSGLLRGTGTCTGACAWSPDADMIALGMREGSVQVWRRDGQFLAHLEGHTSPVRAVDFSPDGRLLLSASSDGTLCMWSSAEVDPVAVLQADVALWGPGSSRLFSVAHTVPRIAVPRTRGTLVFYDTRTGQAAVREQSELPETCCLAFSSDDKRVALAGSTELVIVSAEDGLKLGSWAWAEADSTDHLSSDVAYSPDGSMVAVERPWRTTLHDGTTGNLLRALPKRSRTFASTSALCFAAGGDMLVAPVDSGKAGVWRTSDGKLLWTIDEDGKAIGVLALSPDRRHIATSGYERPIEIWNLAARKVVASTDALTNPVSLLKFARDGRRILIASSESPSRIWHFSGKKEGAVVALRGPPVSTRCADFEPRGDVLATGGDDGMVRIWDPTTGEMIATLRGHLGMVYQVAFSGDGRTLVSDDSKGTVRLWRFEFETRRSEQVVEQAGRVGLWKLSEGLLLPR